MRKLQSANQEYYGNKKLQRAALLGNQAEVRPAGLLMQVGSVSGLLVRIKASLKPGEKVLWIIDWRIFSKIATSHSMEP
jgi:hypothetical protein